MFSAFVSIVFVKTMPYYQTWEEFARAAEKLYLTDPMKVITLYLISTILDSLLAKWHVSDVTVLTGGSIFFHVKF